MAGKPPNAPTILPYLAATVHNALIWAASGRAEPASKVLQKFLVDEGLAGNHEYVPRYCLSCGCTEEYACPGGCGWSNAPWICTKCAEKER